MVGDPEEPGDSPSRQQLVQLWAQPGTNPALEAERVLRSIVCDPASGLDMIMHFFGAFDEWAAARRRLARRAILLTLAELRKKLVEPWTCYPWKLLQLVDESLPWASRWQAALDFLA
eukprot:3646507-Amphidinium_carterae.1